MGVSADHLVADGVDDLSEAEASTLLRHLCVEDDLEQEIAKFLAQFFHIVFLDGLGYLVRLFQSVGKNGSEILL